MSEHEEKTHPKIEDLPRTEEALTPEQAEETKGGLKRATSELLIAQAQIEMSDKTPAGSRYTLADLTIDLGAG